VGALAHLLKDRCFIGEVAYRGEVHRGEHQPILDAALFEAVQGKIAALAAALPAAGLTRAANRPHL
jgi:hypothetical protein